MSVLDMRRNPFRTSKVKTLNGRRSLILRLHHQGYNNKVIAERLNRMGITCTPQNVSDIINSPLGMEKLLDLSIRAEDDLISNEAAVNKQIDEILPAAFDNIKSAITKHRVGQQGVKAADVLALSKHILDVRGISPVRRVAATVDHEHLVLGDAINMIKERADTLKKGNVLEAEYTITENDEDIKEIPSFEDALSNVLGV